MLPFQPPIPFSETMTGAFASLCWRPHGGIRFTPELWARDSGLRIQSVRPEVIDGLPPSAPGQRQKWLVTREHGADVWHRSQAYSPSQHPNLHRDFAATTGSPNDLVAFANAYGFLGRVYILEDGAEGGVRKLWGEPYRYWLDRAEEMAHLIELWDVVRGLKERILPLLEAEKLQPYVEWSEVGGRSEVRFKPGPVLMGGEQLEHKAREGGVEPEVTRLSEAGYPIRDPAGALRQQGDWDVTLAQDPRKPIDDSYGPAPPGDGDAQVRRVVPSLVARGFPGDPTPEISAQLEYGDPVGPMHYFVHRYVTSQLEGRVTPALLPLETGSKLVLFTDTLLTALYALFALEITGQTRHKPRVCPGCGQVFVPAHGRRRYHDERCKSRFHRGNRLREREMTSGLQVLK